jgi:hypothetical protein
MGSPATRCGLGEAQRWTQGLCEAPEVGTREPGTLLHLQPSPSFASAVRLTDVDQVESGSTTSSTRVTRATRAEQRSDGGPPAPTSTTSARAGLSPMSRSVTTKRAVSRQFQVGLRLGHPGSPGESTLGWSGRRQLMPTLTRDVVVAVTHVRCPLDAWLGRRTAAHRRPGPPVDVGPARLAHATRRPVDPLVTADGRCTLIRGPSRARRQRRDRARAAAGGPDAGAGPRPSRHRGHPRQPRLLAGPGCGSTLP